jgi:hypothetical protein
VWWLSFRAAVPVVLWIVRDGFMRVADTGHGRFRTVGRETHRTWFEEQNQVDLVGNLVRA